MAQLPQRFQSSYKGAARPQHVGTPASPNKKNDNKRTRRRRKRRSSKSKYDDDPNDVHGSWLKEGRHNFQSKLVDNTLNFTSVNRQTHESSQILPQVACTVPPTAVDESMIGTIQLVLSETNTLISKQSQQTNSFSNENDKSSIEYISDEPSCASLSSGINVSSKEDELQQDSKTNCFWDLNPMRSPFEGDLPDETVVKVNCSTIPMKSRLQDAECQTIITGDVISLNLYHVDTSNDIELLPTCGAVNWEKDDFQYLEDVEICLTTVPGIPLCHLAPQPSLKHSTILPSTACYSPDELQ